MTSFLLHQRNQSALEELHNSERHRAANDDIEQQIRRLLASSDIPAAVRVRMACSVGAVMAGLLAEGLVDDVPHEQRIALRARDRRRHVPRAELTAAELTDDEQGGEVMAPPAV